MKNKFAFLCGLLSATLSTIGIINFGPGLSGDSACYLSAGKNLANGHGLMMYNGEFMTAYAPMMSAVIAFFEKMGVDPKLGYFLFSSACLFALVFVGTKALLQSLSNKSVSLIACSHLAIAAPLIFVTMNIWSEPAFNLLVVLSIVMGAKYIQMPKIRTLLWLSVFVSLAWMFRYAGLTLYISFGLLILIFPKGLSILLRLRNSALFALIAGLANAMWIFRNVSVSGHLAGERTFTPSSWWNHFKFMMQTLLRWFVFPILGAPQIQVILGVIGLILFSALAIFLYRNLRRQTLRSEIVFVSVWFFLIYSLFNLGMVSSFVLDPMTNRMCSPIYFPLLIVVFYFLGWLADRLSQTQLKAFFVILILFLITPAVNTGGLLYRAVTKGNYFYEGPSFSKSQIVSFLKENSLNGSVYSNSPEAIYLLTGITAKDNYRNLIDDSLAKGEEVFFVWFPQELRTGRDTPEDYKKTLKADAIVEYLDGAVYKLKGN